MIELTKQIEDLKDQLNKCIQENNEFNQSFHTISEYKSFLKETEKVLHEDICDRIKRQNRVVIFNVPYFPSLVNSGVFFNNCRAGNDDSIMSKLMSDLGMHSIPVECFRVVSGKNSHNSMPPLIVEFISKQQRNYFLRVLRQKVKNASQDPELWYASYFSAAPDISFKDRQKYKALKEEMLNKNNELISLGNVGEKWIIKDLKR